MSYEFQDPGAVVLSWVGAAAYTPPDAGAVELRFSPDMPTAAGFCNTAFGSPGAVYAQTAQANGWQSGGVGASPTSSAVVHCTASGWEAPTFGAPQSLIGAGTPAGAIHSTEYGTPAAHQIYRAATIGKVASFGTPNSPYEQILSATGNSHSKCGTPMAYSLPTTAIPRTVASDGFCSTSFGSPDIAHPALGIPPGASFGVASARQSFGTAGFAVGSFGQPAAAITAHGIGFQAAAMGAPSIVRGLRAQGSSASRFGVPGIRRSNTFGAHALGPVVRFAQPAAFLRINYPAVSVEPTSKMGAPTCSQQYRALHTAPGARFGQPLRIRGTTC